jgi:hypothetical protein
MAFNGDTQNFSTIQVLNLIRLALKTGKLIFTGTYTAELFFSEGQLIYATQNSNVPDNLLQILFKAGKLAQAQVEQIQEQIADVGDLWLSQWLLETGYVTKSDLAQSVHRQVLHTIYETILRADGDFIFEEEVLPSLDVPVTAVDLRQVIDQGDRLLQGWAEVETAMPDVDITLKATERLTSAAGRLLTKTEWLVATACNGQRPMRQIIQALNLDDFQARHTIHHLLKIEMVEIVSPPAEKPLNSSVKPAPPSKFEAALQNIRSGLQQQVAPSW